MDGKRAQGAWGGVHLAGVAIILLIAMGAGVTDVSAIPAFARKYHTSCQTCHVAFPNLTPFGEAFRLNGYRFPAGTDVNMSKDQPVELGAEGYKKLWPKSVWPGEIPGLPPVSMVVENEVAYDKAAKTTSFDGLPAEIALLTGGTLGEHASFYGEVEFEREDGEIATAFERINVQFRPLSTPAFQFKIGSFEPGLLLVSNHRRLTDHKYFLLGMPAGDNGWAAEPWQQGVEFFGVVSHRLLYNAGYVEGSGNVTNNSKDYYARLAYKFGGLRLDGTTKEGGDAGMASNPKPWSEKSLRVSAFVYKGRPFVSDMMALSQNDPFRMYGGDIAWNFKDLMVNAGMSERTDRRPFLADPANTDVKVKNRFGEISWVAYPWLVPAARWESFEIDGLKTERVSLTANFLIRANVKGFVAADQVKTTGTSYETEEVVGGVVLGF